MPCTHGFKLVAADLSGLVLVLLMADALIAQSISGALHGTVTDASGAVIPGAVIEVKNLGNAQIRTATTDRRGYYAVADSGARRIFGDYFEPWFRDGDLARG